MNEFSEMLSLLSEETKTEFPRIAGLLRLCATGGALLCEQMLPRSLAHETEKERRLLKQKELEEQRLLKEKELEEQRLLKQKELEEQRLQEERANQIKLEQSVRDYLLEHDLQKVSAQELGIQKTKVQNMPEIVTPEESLAHKIEKLFEKGGENFLAFDEILWRLREVYGHASSIYKLKACLHLTERPVALRKRLTFPLRFPRARPNRTVWGITTNPSQDEIKNVPLSGGSSSNEEKPVDSSLLLPRSNPRRRSIENRDDK